MLRRYIKPVYVFRQKEVESEYVGTQVSWVMSHIIYANISNATNRLTSEIYGEKVSNMFSLICGLQEEVKEGDRISFDDIGKVSYKVVSIMRYNTHKTALVEVLV